MENTPISREDYDLMSEEDKLAYADSNFDYIEKAKSEVDNLKKAASEELKKARDARKNNSASNDGEPKGEPAEPKDDRNVSDIVKEAISEYHKEMVAQKAHSEKLNAFVEGVVSADESLKGKEKLVLKALQDISSEEFSEEKAMEVLNDNGINYTPPKLDETNSRGGEPIPAKEPTKEDRQNKQFWLDLRAADPERFKTYKSDHVEDYASAFKEENNKIVEA